MIRFKVLVISAFFFSFSAASAGPTKRCALLLTSLVNSTDATSTYVALLRNLALEKNALTLEALQHMLKASHLADPLEYLSREMNSAERFAFTRGFSSLREVDWELAKNELGTLAEALAGREIVKEDAVAKTAPIYAAIDFTDVTAKHSMSTDLVFTPKGRAPIFTTFQNGSVTFVDLEAQTLRPHKLIGIGNEAYVQLDDGRVLIAYASQKGSRITIEDFDSGAIIDSADLGAGFLKSEAARGRSPMSLFQKADGGLKLIVPHARGLRFVYDFGTKRGYTLQPVNDEGIHNHSFEDGLGDVYDFTTERVAHEKYKFSLYRLENGGPEKVMDGVELPRLGGYYSHGIVVFQDGRFAMSFDAVGSLALLNPGAKKFKTFKFKSKDYDLVEPVEWPTGELRALAQRVRRGKRTITLIDQTGERLSWVLPSAEHESVHFNSLKLRDGRVILAVEHFVQGETSRVSFLDVSQSQVLSVSFSGRSISHFEHFYQSSDGRILGLYNDDNGRVRTLQLYGPITAEVNAQ